MSDGMRDIQSLLTAAQAAEFLGWSPGTLARRRMDGTGPKYLKMGCTQQAQIRYRLSDLQEYLDGLVRRSTSDPGPEAAA